MAINKNMKDPVKVIIMGAAGRDFHNFNVYFKDNPGYRVIAFTATQIPDIEGRTYPAELAGRLYHECIPIFHEQELVSQIKADMIMFLTTVDRVALDYNTPQQIELERLSLAEAQQYLREGQFPPGSMGPKIEAAVEFVEKGGDRAVVCRPEYVVEALAGRAGTVIE